MFVFSSWVFCPAWCPALNDLATKPGPESTAVERKGGALTTAPIGTSLYYTLDAAVASLSVSDNRKTSDSTPPRQRTKDPQEPAP